MQPFKAWRESKHHQRAKRALARQLDYQKQKSELIKGAEADVMKRMMLSSSRVRDKLNTFKRIEADVRVAEIGSGAHGLIFFFNSKRGVGVDPLAANYAGLFPKWQRRVPTVSAVGESLPFPDKAFEVVLCDNVVDHAESPVQIVAELARILSPGGLLYFTVNVHHPIYALASHVHGAWNAVGLNFEVGPFADHTTHLRLSDARRLFEGLPLRILSEHSNVADAKAFARRAKRRHLADFGKQVFFKNALYSVIAERNPA
jgi:SAM-dependent methyltransferase